MDLNGLKVYTIYINDDPGLTLIYFKTRSDLVKIAYCAKTGTIRQVSVYRNIGPLVCVSI